MLYPKAQKALSIVFCTTLSTMADTFVKYANAMIFSRYRQYIPNKQHSWRIKAYVLADSLTGFTYDFIQGFSLAK